MGSRRQLFWNRREFVYVVAAGMSEGPRRALPMARTDVTVLGAGIVGTSTTLHLAKRGLSRRSDASFSGIGVSKSSRKFVLSGRLRPA